MLEDEESAAWFKETWGWFTEQNNTDIDKLVYDNFSIKQLLLKWTSSHIIIIIPYLLEYNMKSGVSQRTPPPPPSAITMATMIRGCRYGGNICDITKNHNAPNR